MSEMPTGDNTQAQEDSANADPAREQPHEHGEHCDVGRGGRPHGGGRGHCRGGQHHDHPEGGHGRCHGRQNRRGDHKGGHHGGGRGRCERRRRCHAQTDRTATLSESD